MNTAIEILRTNLKRLREEKGLTQKELTERAGLGHSYVNKIETDDLSPSLNALEQLADVLDVEVYELLKQQN